MLISTIYKSLLRATHDLVDRIHLETGHADLEYFAWESRLDEAELPKVDLIGISGYGFKENGGLWEISFGLSLSSYRDAHLFREAEMLDVVHKQFGDGNTIALRDPQTGDVTSELVVAEGSFEILPMGRSELRNYRSVAMELLRTAA